MNILQEIKNIPGIIVWSQETTEDDKNLITCRYNWVFNEEDFGFVYLPKTAFSQLKWEKQKGSEYSETYFSWNESKIPILFETKLYHGYIVDKMRFSIKFEIDLENKPENISRDLSHVKNIVSDFEVMKKEIELSLKNSIPPAPKV